MAKNKAVFGIVHSREELDTALELLRGGGFPAEDISILLSHNVGTHEIVTEKASKGPEGATAGGVAGAAAGGMLGWLASVGVLAIPGIGPFMAAGPMMAMLAGMGAGAVLGGATGALVGIGIPEYEAKRYEGMLHKGGILISVHSDNDESTSLAKELLGDAHAEAIESTGEATTYFDKSIPQV